MDSYTDTHPRPGQIFSNPDLSACWPTPRDADRGPTHAWTGSRYIDMMDPQPAQIVLHEVAVGLSREARYGGAATSQFWSVAQHTLLCAEFARQAGFSLASRRLVFAHDFPEYMLRDMIAPAKRGMPEYRALEDVWWRAVARRFHLPATLPPQVKHIDMLAAASEKAAFISSAAGDWPGFPDPRPVPSWLTGMGEDDAYEAFMRTAHGLGFA